MILNLAGGAGTGGKSELVYAGNHTVVVYNGTDGLAYKLYTIMGSGTLTAKNVKSADIWMCGGGSNGIKAGGGGAGAYATTLMAQELSGTYAVVIGTGNGGVTSLGEIATANGVAGTMNGGTGGGAFGGYSAVGTGDGVSKYPFGDSTFFKCHCAGGGGGGYSWREENGMSSSKRGGGTGGTNGGNGKNDGAYASPTPEDTSASGGIGGDYGGGKGGYGAWRDSSASGGSAATFYGSGGGGGGNGQHYSDNEKDGGAGYQGVMYIRIPA